MTLLGVLFLKRSHICCLKIRLPYLLESVTVCRICYVEEFFELTESRGLIENYVKFGLNCCFEFEIDDL